MNWEYIAGIFDSNGRISLSKTQKSLAIQVKISNQNRNVLLEIIEFCDSEEIKELGSVYNKDRTDGFNLIITKKENALLFLKGIIHHLECKREEVYYVLDNYDFSIGESNFVFDLERFKKITEKISSEDGIVKNDYYFFPNLQAHFRNNSEVLRNN